MTCEMDSIINNPGLQHIADLIFSCLNFRDLNSCQKVHPSWKRFLENPIFWLKKCTGISKENRKMWLKILQDTKSSLKIQKNISLYLKRAAALKNNSIIDIPCYISENDIKKLENIENKDITRSAFADFLSNRKRKCNTKNLKSEFMGPGIIQAWICSYDNASFSVLNSLNQAIMNGRFDIVTALIPFITPEMVSKVTTVSRQCGSGRVSHIGIYFTPIQKAILYKQSKIIRALIPLAGDEVFKNELPSDFKNFGPEMYQYVYEICADYICHYTGGWNVNKPLDQLEHMKNVRMVILLSENGLKITLRFGESVGTTTFGRKISIDEILSKSLYLVPLNE